MRVPRPDDPVMLAQRARRLREVMARNNVDAVLTADPINIVYGCGARNMTVFGLMGPARFMMVFADGHTVLWEFAGCEHLVHGNPEVAEVRAAPGITANSGPGYPLAIASFAREIDELCRHHVGASARLAVERLDFEMCDALRSRDLVLRDATSIFLAARIRKQPAEVEMIREAVKRVSVAVGVVEQSITPGLSENEIWSHLHQQLIANDGEYISTRLLQAGPNTFPYFREASDRSVREGELLCLDTDAIGVGGYGVDFSRTFLVGDGDPTNSQRTLYRRAHEQLQHNAALLGPGVSFENFARSAWPVPAEHSGFGYYCLAHGLGMAGEHPYVPLHTDSEDYPLVGEFEPSMVICIESYIGDEASGQGVKLEDQYLVTEHGAELLTTYRFDSRLLG